jgi:hypothetical protein
MNEYYFSYKGDLPKILKTRFDKYSKVKSSADSILYKTNNWDDSLSTILGNPLSPKYSSGEEFKVDGNIEKIDSIEPIFVSNSWTFKYHFQSGKYRLEDQI